MKNALRPLLAAILLLSVALPLQAGTRILNREGMIGAATGAVAGGIIGHQLGERPEGALIGGVAGYAIGTAMHRQKQHQRSAERQIQQEREQARLREAAHRREATPMSDEETFPTAPRPAPRLTRSQEQQLLLQVRPLYSTIRRE